MGNNVRIEPLSSSSPSPSKTEIGNTYAPTKPVLPRLIDSHKSLGKILDQATHGRINRLEYENAHLQIWTQKELDHLLAMSQRSWLEHGWSTVKSMAESVISIASFVAGGYLLTQGNTGEASLLIAGGVFNILQSLFASQGAWNWITETLAEKHESKMARLKILIPLTASMLSFAMSIAGTQYFGTSNIIPFLETAKGTLSVGSKITEKLLSFSKIYRERGGIEIQGQLKHHELNIDLFSRFMDFFMKESRRLKSTVKKPINNLLQSTTLAAQKV